MSNGEKNSHEKQEMCLKKYSFTSPSVAKANRLVTGPFRQAEDLCKNSAGAQSRAGELERCCDAFKRDTGTLWALMKLSMVENDFL